MTGAGNVVLIYPKGEPSYVAVFPAVSVMVKLFNWYLVPGLKSLKVKKYHVPVAVDVTKLSIGVKTVVFKVAVAEVSLLSVK